MVFGTNVFTIVKYEMKLMRNVSRPDEPEIVNFSWASFHTQSVFLPAGFSGIYALCLFHLIIVRSSYCLLVFSFLLDFQIQRKFFRVGKQYPKSDCFQIFYPTHRIPSFDFIGQTLSRPILGETLIFILDSFVFSFGRLSSLYLDACPFNHIRCLAGITPPFSFPGSLCDRALLTFSFERFDRYSIRSFINGCNFLTIPGRRLL